VGPEFPRVDVRITDLTPESEAMGTMATARLGDRIIWVPASTLEDDYDLHRIVFHELLHAVYSIRHIESCPLMRSRAYLKAKVTPFVLDNIFLNYARRSKL
jgi:hypothetical protein